MELAPGFGLDRSGTDRALATVDVVLSLEPIPGADRIVLARVRGWTCVVGRDEFREGEPCVYFEPDSFLPASDSRFMFLERFEPARPHPLTGVMGYRIRARRLRGVYSYGLVMPLGLFPELADYAVGSDVSAALGVVKWETPPPAVLGGIQRGPFPSWVMKTDELRIQNVPVWVLDQIDSREWYATEKLDGSSMTVYWDEDYAGVCSRNIDLREDDQNLFWRVAREYELHALARAWFPNAPRVALQGELIGPGVQKNPLRLKTHRFALFTIQVGPDRLPFAYWPESAAEWMAPLVPLEWPGGRDSALAQVDQMRSRMQPSAFAEGVVWRHRTRNWVEHPVTGERWIASFKVISPSYLLKQEE